MQPLPVNKDVYPELIRIINKELSEEQKSAEMRRMCIKDLFFLLVYGMGRFDANNDWLFDRCREVQASPDSMLDLWSREHYKDFNINEPIATPTGWKKHGDLVVGDWVYGSNGEPVMVVALSPRYSDAECYKITFDDGYKAICGSGHLWEVEHRSRARISGTNKRKYREKVVLATHEIAELNHESDNRLSIPVAPALLNIEHILPVEPYLMGLWLGDGHSANGRITNADFEIWDYIRDYGYELSNPAKTDNGLAETKNIYGLMPKLREAGVLSNKHIPRSYAWASEKQRRELLQGLMDSDGHCSIRGTATFCNQNEQLSNDVYDLCQSLGLKPSIYRYEGEKESYWQVAFQAYQHDAPFRIERKLGRCKVGKRPSPRRYIVSVERVNTVETSCIQVDAKDGIYLVGRNLVPTHNSTIITFALTIQDILKDPEVTIGIFSHTRPIAKGFLRQIKRELELNDNLKAWFPDILYSNPSKEAVKWSEDDGIIVKRSSNPKEATVEAYGVVDGQPTSKHFSLLVYDDIVTRESVTTPDMIEKTTDALALSFNLGAHGGRRRFIGTRYHFADTYKTIMERGSATPRIHAATDDGTVSGNPVFLTQEQLDNKRRDMGPFVYSCQMLQNPVADSSQGFNREWLNRYSGEKIDSANWYLLVDAANGKRKNNDYTSMWAVGLGMDGNYYAIPEVRDRLNLTERTNRLIALHRKYKPVEVRYEKYGMMADVEYILAVQDKINYRFPIVEVGGAMPKTDRIKRLIPIFETGKLFIPHTHSATDYEGKARDNVHAFIEEEYCAFPVPLHDDMLDALARICETKGRKYGHDGSIDLFLQWPDKQKQRRQLTRSTYTPQDSVIGY